MTTLLLPDYSNLLLQDYWQNKLEDERGFYEHQLRQNEQQFNQLESRMKVKKERESVWRLIDR